MPEIETDAPVDSSTTTSETVSESLTEVVAADSTTADVGSESSPEVAPEKQFSDIVEKLEEGKGPKEAVKQESEALTEADKDEPVTEKAKDAKVLSQADEEALTKQFAERPEWKKVLSLTPKAQQKEVRQAMRTIFERETVLHSQIESQKPVLQKFERFQKGVGNDEAVENTIRLVEFYQQGDPRALQMLDALRNDLLARTGQVLTSKDLVDRAKQIDTQMEQGTLDEAEASQRKQDLLELEKARVGNRRVEQTTQERQQADLQRNVQAQQTEMTNAANAWETEKMASDPDFPSLKQFVENEAFRIGNERQLKLEGKRLLNGAEMKQVLDDALKAVKEATQKLLPKPKARQVLNGNGSSATSRRAPANEREAFEQEIERLEAKRR